MGARGDATATRKLRRPVEHGAEPISYDRKGPDRASPDHRPRPAPIYDVRLLKKRILYGVIAMDALALAELTRATGAVVGDGWDVEVGPDNAARVLLHDAYLQFESEVDQEDYIGSVIAAFWRKVTRGDIDGAALAEALPAAVAGRNFQLYDHKEAEALATLGVDGSIEGAGPNLLMVFHNHLASNKTDYFLRRSINTTIRLHRDGSAEGLTKIVLRNEAPDGPPSDLLGHGGEGYAPGSNTMYLTAALPPGAVVEELRGSPPGGEPIEGAELGFPTVSTVVDLAPGQRRTITVSFRLPRAVDLDAGEPKFELTLLPQATATPDRYSIVIVPPPGYEPEDAGRTRDSGAAVFEGRLEATTTLGLRLTR